VKLTSKLESLA